MFHNLLIRQLRPGHFYQSPTVSIVVSTCYTQSQPLVPASDWREGCYSSLRQCQIIPELRKFETLVHDDGTGMENSTVYMSEEDGVVESFNRHNLLHF